MAVARVVRGISRFKKTRITDPSSCPSIPFLFVFFLNRRVNEQVEEACNSNNTPFLSSSLELVMAHPVKTPSWCPLRQAS